VLRAEVVQLRREYFPEGMYLDGQEPMLEAWVELPPRHNESEYEAACEVWDIPPRSPMKNASISWRFGPNVSGDESAPHFRRRPTAQNGTGVPATGLIAGNELTAHIWWRIPTVFRRLDKKGRKSTLLILWWGHKRELLGATVLKENVCCPRAPPECQLTPI
jgi:hypothetical protein